MYVSYKCVLFYSVKELSDTLLKCLHTILNVKIVLFILMD